MDEKTLITLHTTIAVLEKKVEDLSALNDALSKKLDGVFQAIEDTFEQVASLAGVGHDLDSVIKELARIHGNSEGEWRA